MSLTNVVCSLRGEQPQFSSNSPEASSSSQPIPTPETNAFLMEVSKSCGAVTKRSLARLAASSTDTKPVSVMEVTSLDLDATLQKLCTEDYTTTRSPSLPDIDLDDLGVEINP